MDEPNVTIIKDSGSGSGGSWLVGIILLVALVVGGFFMMNYMEGRSAKDNAIVNAANSVGDAADNVGAAADNVTEATKQPAK